MSQAGRILIADDETMFGRPLAELFRREGYEAEAVVDAASALNRLREQTFDLLISDIEMPGNSGLEFIQQVPKLAPGLPVILLTGRPSVATAIGAVNLAVAGYFVKPPDFDHLLGLARKTVAGYRAARHAQEHRRHLQQWLAEVEQLEVALTKPAEAPGAASPGDFVALTSQNLRVALFEFTKLTELVAQAENQASVRQHANMVQALRKTVEVLERTRRNFKSVELRDLRVELEHLIQGTGDAAPPGDGRTG